MSNQGPQGNPIKPVGGYDFLPAAPAESPAAAPAPANEAAPAPQVAMVDTAQYAEAISHCIQVHPDLNEVMAKFLGIAGALQRGHDVQEVVYALAQTCAQFVGVVAVKQQQAGDPDAEAAMDEIGSIAEELKEGIEKVILPKPQKDRLLGLVERILDITDEFAGDEEDEEEDGE